MWFISICAFLLHRKTSSNCGPQNFQSGDACKHCNKMKVSVTALGDRVTDTCGTAEL